jgi:hypothetical protein
MYKGWQCGGLPRTCPDLLPPQPSHRGTAAVLRLLAGSGTSCICRHAMPWPCKMSVQEFAWLTHTLRINPDSNPALCMAAQSKNC